MGNQLKNYSLLNCLEISLNKSLIRPRKCLFNIANNGKNMFRGFGSERVLCGTGIYALFYHFLIVSNGV